MSERERRLVLDANILIRLVLGVRVRELVLKHGEHVSFFAPRECFEDARTYLPEILARRGVEPEAALDVLDRFEGLIQPLNEAAYVTARAEAVARIGTRDEKDWPILAAALVLDCPIWAEDQDFFGPGVATWTTDRVEMYLSAEEG